MKKVEAFIRHFKLEDVATALVPLGITGMTVSEGRGTVTRRPWLKTSSDLAEFLPKIKLELAVADELVTAVVETIQRVAQTGHRGDGKILVTHILQATHIRTGETLTETLKASA